MKIVHQNFKHGEVKLEIENADDLWSLSSIIEKGDVVKGRTFRKIKASETAQAIKKPMFLSLSVEQVEFSESSTQLRITGKVIEGPEDVPHGSFHSFALEPSSVITLIKEEWHQYQIEKLKESSESKAPKILICAFDREESTFALLKRKGCEILLNIKGEVVRKRMPEKPKVDFYEQIIKHLEEYNKRFELDKIILASPSFWKEELYEHLKNNQLKQKIIQANCSGADENAIKEVLKRDELKEVLRQDRASKEIKLVEQLLAEIAKDGKAAYGKKEVLKSIEDGAVEILLVSDGLIKKERKDEKFEALEKMMKLAEKNGAKIVVISSEHDGGKKLDGLGGVGAILRWKME